jgi:hypothetical protein
MKLNSAVPARLIERQIAAMDKRGDQLVYKLYGLTKEEIRTVERK